MTTSTQAGLRVFVGPRLAPIESPLFALLRSAAATLAISAGVLHFAQVGPHMEEDPRFGAFFLALGLIELAGGFYLFSPVGSHRARLAVAWVGVVGSLATICIWAISRTIGLPFGPDPGTPEAVGLADVASDLLELFTAALLAIWVYRARLARRHLGAVAIAGAASAFAFAALWLAAWQLDWIGPDPELSLPSQFADLAAVVFLVVLGIVFARGLFLVRIGARASRAVSFALLATLVLAELSLVGATLPARGGEDSCAGMMSEEGGPGPAMAPPCEGAQP
jgi:hypothetical protein